MITKDNYRLGKNIKKYRKSNKLTQQELADKVRVTPKYIQYVESAKRSPSLKVLYKIAKALEVKTKDLLDF